MARKTKIWLCVGAAVLAVIILVVCVRFRPISFQEMAGGHRVTHISVLKQENFGSMDVLYNVLYDEQDETLKSLSSLIDVTYRPVSAFFKGHEFRPDVVDLIVLCSREPNDTLLYFVVNNYGEILLLDSRVPFALSDYRLTYFNKQSGVELYNAIDSPCLADPQPAPQP